MLLFYNNKKIKEEMIAGLSRMMEKLDKSLSTEYLDKLLAMIEDSNFN